MKYDNTTFETSDGTLLEIVMHAATGPRSCLLVWPCFAGNANNYGVPIQTFLEQGCSVVLYNPRGHGRSSNQMAMKRAINDLIEFIKHHCLDQTPLVAVGHSAGANGLLEVSRAIENFERFYLIAPGFDPRDAIFHMYRKGTINGFAKMLTGFTEDGEVIKKLLASDAWMDFGYFKSNQLRTRLDALPGRFHIGRLLEEQFFTGINSYDILGRQREKTQIFLPQSDNWQPTDTTIRLAERYDIPMIRLKSAKEHLFLDAWPDVWAHIEKECFFSHTIRFTNAYPEKTMR